MAKIKRGDAYQIPVTLTLDGEKIPAGDIRKIEVWFAKKRMLYPGKLTYEDGKLTIPVTQEDTFALRAGSSVRIDIRVGFRDGSVRGIFSPISVDVVDALSTEKL